MKNRNTEFSNKRMEQCKPIYQAIMKKVFPIIKDLPNDDHYYNDRFIEISYTAHDKNVEIHYKYPELGNTVRVTKD